MEQLDCEAVAVGGVASRKAAIKGNLGARQGVAEEAEEASH